MTDVITRETVNRLLKDVKEIYRNPLKDHGIYYQQDEEDMLKGYALIVGPPDTPYFGGFYYFKLNFPYDYPHSPPGVEYCTNGDGIRFNPNLYKCGKVCISLLNTWRGEQWTSCQTITTVLLNLCTLLNKEPLLNEPGVTKFSVDFPIYNKIIEFKNIDVAMLNMVTHKEGYYPNSFSMFDSVVTETFLKNGKEVWNFIQKQEKEKNVFTTVFYRMKVEIDYVALSHKFLTVYNSLADEKLV